jgi:hypothetical protein
LQYPAAKNFLLPRQSYQIGKKIHRGSSYLPPFHFILTPSAENANTQQSQKIICPSAKNLPRPTFTFHEFCATVPCLSSAKQAEALAEAFC